MSETRNSVASTLYFKHSKGPRSLFRFLSIVYLGRAALPSGIPGQIPKEGSSRRSAVGQDVTRVIPEKSMRQSRTWNNLKAEKLLSAPPKPRHPDRIFIAIEGRVVGKGPTGTKN